MLSETYARQLEENGFVAADHQRPHVFPVEVLPMVVQRPIKEDGDKIDYETVEIPNHRAIMRIDTGQVLSVMTDRYKVIPNEIIFDAFEAAIARSGIDTAEMRVGTDMAYNGARTFRQYLFPAITRQVGSAEIALRIIAFNSYDGSTAVKLRGGFYSFVCANTSIVGEDLEAITVRHTDRFDIDEIAERVVSACDAYQKGADALVRLPKVKVEDRQAIQVFKAMPGASKQLVDHLVHRFVEVKHERSHPNGGANLWAVYNVLTEWSTHGETKGENAAATKAEREQKVWKVTQSAAWKELAAS